MLGDDELRTVVRAIVAGHAEPLSEAGLLARVEAFAQFAGLARWQHAVVELVLQGRLVVTMPAVDVVDTWAFRAPPELAPDGRPAGSDR